MTIKHKTISAAVAAALAVALAAQRMQAAREGNPWA